MNILTPAGYWLARDYVNRIRPEGCVWFGTPCASWAWTRVCMCAVFYLFLCIYFLFVWCSEVWMSRATSGRSKQNLKGNVACSFVKFGNRTKSITANLMKLACSRNVRVVLETPPSSLMPFTRQIRSSLRICRARRHYICLGVFGAPSAKPTLLWLP
jgi:hypothetical protein